LAEGTFSPEYSDDVPMRKVDGVNGLADGREGWSRFARVAQNLVAIAIVGGFAFYLWKNRSVFEAAVDLSWHTFSAVGVGVLLTWLASSAQTFVLYRAAGVRIGFWETFLVAMATAVANYLPMRLGTLVRLRYLKAVHGLGYARSISVAGIRLVLLIVATGLLGLCGLLGIYATTGRLSVELAAIFAGLLGLACIAAFRRPPVTRGQNRLFRIWNNFSEGFATIRNQPAVAAQVLTLILLQLFLMGWRFQLSLEIVGSDPSYSSVLVLAPSATLVSFVSIVPGGLGLREAVMGYVTLSTQMTFAAGLLAGTVDRAVQMSLLLTLGFASLAYVWLRLQRAEADSKDGASSDMSPGRVTRP